MYGQLLHELERVARRYRGFFAWKRLAVCAFAFVVIGLLCLGLAHAMGWGGQVVAPFLAGIAILALIVSVLTARASAHDRRWVARQVEARHSDLRDLLSTAVEQRPLLPNARFGYLQTVVIQNAVQHSQRHDWLDVVPPRKLRRTRWAGLLSLALLAAVTGGLAVYAKRNETTLHLPFLPQPQAEALEYRVTISPGDTETERGSSLVVTARFEGPVPDNSTLVYQSDDEEAVRLPMSLSLSDPLFGGHLADVRKDFTYRVEYADQSTEDFQVSVYDLPELERADASLVFPEYTSQEPKLVEDTRRITAVEGTELTLLCRLNIPVEQAQLVSEDGKTVELQATTDDPTMYKMTQTLQETVRYKLELVAEAGRRNKLPPEFVFRVTPNGPPDVKVAMPAKDVRVSPIEELETAGSVWDDIGLNSYGISYQLASAEEKQIILGGQAPDRERQQIEHLIELETLQAQPDQLLSYYFWAEDFGPDGKPRRTLGDMYFAEVRHFEEIFREGQQPPGGQQQSQQQQQQGQNAQEASQLAELQKQIINATWTVIRREVGSTPTDEFTPDAQKLLDSQKELLGPLAELAGKLQDPQSGQYVADVKQHMDDAITHLTEAVQGNSIKSLHPALTAEKAAYQALLRLRAREHRVSRGQPQQSQTAQSSASGSQSRAQQQLEQLQLNNSQNRYETQQQALSQQELANQENLQVLNRLRDLARRQDDLNRRLKELQSALEEAQTEQEREEIRRQLKRLRDQEDELLRDLDELAERMERPENQESMADARQNLEQTRQNMRQTTESLREGQVSRAVASGTRAERELKEMREEFQNRTANRFSEEMRQLRAEARRLDQREDELAQQLRDLEQPDRERRQLGDRSKREEVSEGLRQQGEDLQRLLEGMQETSEDAEDAEPLMARQLYDSIRQTQQGRVDDALGAARRLLDAGLMDQSRDVEAVAGQGIEELKEGVEKAADNVLGDETEALRRAHETLTDLAEELGDELATVDGRREQNPEARKPNRASGRPGDARAPDDEQPDSNQQDAKPDSSPAGRPGERPEDSPARPTPTNGKPQPKQSPSVTGGGQPRDGQPKDGQDTGRGGGRERSNQPESPRDGPMGGEDFLEWSDRLREVEEMMDSPDLRSEAARIRDRARGIRREFRRGGTKGPNWDLVQEFVAEPLNELRDRVAEELLRRENREQMVPIDRDPVPGKYADSVRRYYERLGSGK